MTCCFHASTGKSGCSPPFPPYGSCALPTVTAIPYSFRPILMLPPRLAERISQDVALAACDLLLASYPEEFSEAPLALWLSMIAVIGLASCPAVSRVSEYRAL